MGLAASQARLLMLTARKSELELMMQMVCQSRLALANMTSSLYNASANRTPGSADDHKLQQQINAMGEQDKRLEMEMKRLDTQHEAVQTELESVQKIISKNIETSFKIMG